MKIVLSETLSYCFGVRKTLDLTDRLLSGQPDRTYYMLGEIVHNEHVIEALKTRGLRVVQTLEDVPPGGIVILQSHGSSLRRYRELRERGLEYIDATCPMVRIIHERIREIEADGYTPVVIGQVGHEEVQGIVGQVHRALVVRAPEEVTPELFRDVRRAGIVVQSTFVEEDAQRVLERIRELVPEVVFHDTICQPTKARQHEVELHTQTVDCVIVIGSMRSANTLHLFHIAQKNNPCTHLVDSAESVDGIDVPPDATVFVASGASTPEDLILEVVRRLEIRAHHGSAGSGCESGVARNLKMPPEDGGEHRKDRARSEIFRRGSRTYFHSARFFPRPVREDVGFLYGFVRTADDFIDRVPQDAEGFQEFRRAYASGREGGAASAGPVIDRFVEVSVRRGFDPAWAEAFLDSMAMDLVKTDYEDLDETLSYVYGSAEVIGLMMSRIMDLDSEALPYARLLGRAMQYINFLRDIREDLELGRTYLPRSEMRAFGLASLEEAQARVRPEAFREFIKGQIARYRAWQSEAEKGYTFIPRRFRVPIRTAAEMYDWTAERIEADPFVIYRRKVKPSRARISVTGLRNVLKPGGGIR